MPSNNLPIIRIFRRVLIPQLLDNLPHLTMAPGDQNIPCSFELFDPFRHTLNVIALAGCINGEAKVPCDGKDGLIGTPMLAS